MIPIAPKSMFNASYDRKIPILKKNLRLDM